MGKGLDAIGSSDDRLDAAEQTASVQLVGTLSKQGRCGLLPGTENEGQSSYSIERVLVGNTEDPKCDHVGFF